MSYEQSLPSGWSDAALGDLATHPKSIAYGVLKPGPRIPGGVPMLRVTDIRTNEVDESDIYHISHELAEQYRRTTLSGGEVLVSIQGTVGRVALVPDSLTGANVSRTLAVIPPALTELAPWIRWALLSPQGQAAMNSEVGGTTRASLNLGALRLIEVPVPPLEEQHRVTAKLDSLSTYTRNARKSLEAIPPLIEKLQQSVLAAAFQGDLTAEWREQNPDVEPASVLLERIRKERRERWIEEYAESRRAKLEEQARKAGQFWTTEETESVLERERKKAAKKYEEPEPVDPEAEGLPELPEGWCWASLIELSDSVDSLCYGVVQPGESIEGGIPLVRVGDLTDDGDIETANMRTISQDVDSAYARSRLKGGEVLVSLVGTIGRIAIAHESLAGANIARQLGRVSPTSYVEPSWIANALRAPRLQRWLEDGTREVARKTLNIGVLGRAAIPLAPAAEIAQLIAQIEQTEPFRVHVRQQVLGSEILLDNLDQSILAKAYRGELVPQDPDDEPAGSLLERIRADRAKTRAGPVSGKRPRSKKVAISTVDSLRALVLEMPEGHFTFNELRERLPGDYESLREAVFSLLADPKSPLQQHFDAKASQMYFVRTKS